MSGSPATTTPPSNDAELMRDVDKRLGAVETPTATRVGAWVLSTNDGGDLVASYANGGSVLIAAAPQPNSDPDALDTGELPRIKLVSSVEQVNPAGQGIPLVWAATEYSIGDWAATGGETVVTIPEQGIYFVLANINSSIPSSSITKAYLTINDDISLSQEFKSDANSYRNHLLASTFMLAAGDELQMFGWSQTQQGWGTSGLDDAFVSSLTLIRMF